MTHEAADAPYEDEHHIELAYATFAVFADDGSIDTNELNFVLGLALKDGKIDDGERRILAGIFNRIQEHDVSPGVWHRIKVVRKQHGI